MNRPGAVHIGNARGKIALWLDERDAIDLAEMYGSQDLAWVELMEAVEKAYPQSDEEGSGVKIGIEPK